MLRAGHLHYWLRGGRGSGKSSYASLEIVSGLLRDKEYNAIIYRKVADTLRDSVYAQIQWAAETLGIDEWFQYKLSPLEITLKHTGQRIMFRGADDPAKSKGIKLPRGYFKYIWFEELTEFAGEDECRVITNSVLRGGADPVIICTYNPPKTARNWVNAAALIPSPARMLHGSDYRGVPESWLGKAFISEAEHLREVNERQWRSVYLGEVTGTGGAVFENLAIEEIPQSKRGMFDRYMNGLDFGFGVDPSALARCYYSKREQTLYITDEFYSVGAPTNTLAERTLSVCGKDIVSCDSEDPRTIDALRRLGVNALGAKKGPYSVEHGVRWLSERAQIVIDPKTCPNAAREFAGYEYRQDKYGNFIAAYPDENNHTIDAVRYAVEPLSNERTAKVLSKAKLGF
jgi:PBSX family phage terminase large subunit